MNVAEVIAVAGMSATFGGFLGGWLTLLLSEAMRVKRESKPGGPVGRVAVWDGFDWVSPGEFDAARGKKA